MIHRSRSKPSEDDAVGCLVIGLQDRIGTIVGTAAVFNLAISGLISCPGDNGRGCSDA